jgi:amidohydrolase
VNLQQFLSRDIDPTEPAVINVGIFKAGTATNIIPHRVSFEGTARTLTAEMRKHVRECVNRRCAGVAASGGCAAEIEWTDGYPATINDPEMADYVARIAREKLGHHHFIPAARAAMGGEDFAYYLQHVLGCFFLVGVMPHEHESHPPLHSDRFDFTDAAIAVGMKMFVELVMNFDDALKPRMNADERG